MKAPRELLKVLLVDTNYRATPAEIDLAGFRGEDFEQDVILEK